MPQVSIIIPTYNRARFLRAAVASARTAASDSQIIVVDDGSTDDTANACQSLSDIEYIRLTVNQGLAAARNCGIRSATADFVAFVDDDDLRLPGSIDQQVAALRATGAAVCYGRVLLADAKNRLPTGEVLPVECPSGDIFWDLLEGLFLTPVSVLARRDALIAANLFDERLKLAEDWDLWLRIAEHQSFVSLNEPVAIYRKSRTDSQQLCSDVIELMRQMLIVQRAALQRPKAAAAPGWRRRRARQRLLSLAYEALRAEALAALAREDIATARATAEEALQLRPLRGLGDFTLRRALQRSRARDSNGTISE